MNQEIDKLIVFDLKGPIAHFRKFYTNSSSLSYTFPPRTVLTGLIAGILGKPRDSYYEEFSSNLCRLAVVIKVPTRKIMQTLNYLWVKNPKDLNASAGKHLQTQFEVVFPAVSLRSDTVTNHSAPLELIYRVYFWHDDEHLLREVERRVRNKKYVYPPYLGISEFSASLDFVATVSASEFEFISTSEPVKINSVLNIELLEENGLEFVDDGKPRQYIKEFMPQEFYSDRSSKSKAGFISDKKGQDIFARLKVPYINVHGQNIVFMEV